MQFAFPYKRPFFEKDLFLKVGAFFAVKLAFDFRRIGVRAGGGGGGGGGWVGAAAPPKFWATQIFWAAKEIWAKPVLKKVSMFLFFEEIDIFYFNLKSAW